MIYSRRGVSTSGRAAIWRRRNEERRERERERDLKRTKRYPFSWNANGRTSVEGELEEKWKGERGRNEKVEGSSLHSERWGRREGREGNVDDEERSKAAVALSFLVDGRSGEE